MFAYKYKECYKVFNGKSFFSPGHGVGASQGQHSHHTAGAQIVSHPALLTVRAAGQQQRGKETAAGLQCQLFPVTHSRVNCTVLDMKTNIAGLSLVFERFCFTRWFFTA